MKQILPFLFSVMAASLFALTQTVDGITWTYSISDGAAMITSIPTDTAGDVTIPSSLGGYPVTSIGERAFYSRSLLTSVEIPEGVTTIGDYAFYSCSSLTSAVIPESVTWIGSSVFSGCSSLASVVIPEGVTMIGEGAPCSVLPSSLCFSSYGDMWEAVF